MMLFVVIGQFLSFFYIDNPNHFAWLWFGSNVAIFAFALIDPNEFGELCADSVVLFQAWNLSAWLSIFYGIYRLVFA
jgi:hypothetical protein